MNYHMRVPLSSTSCAMLAETLTFPRARIAIRLAGMVAVAISVGGLSNVSYATILEFDQIRESGTVIPTISGRAVELDYGDRVDTSPMNVSGTQQRQITPDLEQHIHMVAAILNLPLDDDGRPVSHRS